MILTESLTALVKEEFSVLAASYQKYVFTRERLLRPLAEDLRGLSTSSVEGLDHYEGDNFIIFKSKLEDFGEFDESGLMRRKYMGDTKRIRDAYSRIFWCFNGYMKELFEDSNTWLKSRETGLELGIKKEIQEEIGCLRTNLRLAEYAFFNRMSLTFGDDFKAAYLFWGGSYLHQRSIILNENGDFCDDTSQRGHWDYVDQGFSSSSLPKEKNITRKLKEKCRIVNPEFLTKGTFIPDFTNIKHYEELLRHAKSTRVISWRIPSELSNKTLKQVPREILLGSYDWIHYDRDFTTNFSAQGVVFDLLKPKGIISCKNGWHSGYQNDERFETLYYNEEGDYALFRKV